jgi:hypothetical protein
MGTIRGGLLFWEEMSESSAININPMKIPCAPFWPRYPKLLALQTVPTPETHRVSFP